MLGVGVVCLVLWCNSAAAFVPSSSLSGGRAMAGVRRRRVGQSVQTPTAVLEESSPGTGIGVWENKHGRQLTFVLSHPDLRAPTDIL